MLDTPVQPNPGLERSLAVKAPWKVVASLIRTQRLPVVRPNNESS